MFGTLQDFFKRLFKQNNQFSPTLTIDKMEYERLKQQLVNKEIDLGASVNIFLLKEFFNISNSKQDVIKVIDNEIKESYIAQLIVNRILDDALTPSMEKEFIQVNIKNNNGVDETLTNLVREFLTNMNIKNILLDVAYELLFYGEYFLRNEVIEGEGIVNIKDDVDLTSIIPVFRDSKISYYLKYKADEKAIVNESPFNYTYFYMPGNRIRVKTHAIDDKVLYIRMGKSLFYPVFGLIRELNFFEQLIPTAIIQKLNSPKIVGVNVPANTSPDEALNIVRTYQKMFDKNLAKHNNYNSPEELLKEIQNTNKIKIIPIWGDQKGSLEPQDVSNDTDIQDMQDKIDDLRQLIIRTLGLPLNFIGAEEAIKSDLIKQYATYVKVVKSLQQALEFGLRQIILTHLNNLGFNITDKDIDIQFINTIDYDNLQRLEIMDINISFVDNLIQFVDNLEQVENVNVNKRELIDLINNQFKGILGKNIIEYVEETDNEE